MLPEKLYGHDKKPRPLLCACCEPWTCSPDIVKNLKRDLITRKATTIGRDSMLQIRDLSVKELASGMSKTMERRTRWNSIHFLSIHKRRFLWENSLGHFNGRKLFSYFGMLRRMSLILIEARETHWKLNSSIVRSGNVCVEGSTKNKLNRTLACPIQT